MRGIYAVFTGSFARFLSPYPMSHFRFLLLKGIRVRRQKLFFDFMKHQMNFANIMELYLPVVQILASLLFPSLLLCFVFSHFRQYFFFVCFNSLYFVVLLEGVTIADRQRLVQTQEHLRFHRSCFGTALPVRIRTFFFLFQLCPRHMQDGCIPGFL